VPTAAPPGPSACNISIVIPVFNSEKTLALVVESVAEILDSRNLTSEFILVDDGSADRSWDVVSELASKRSNVHGIRFRRNYGQHNAVLAGVRAANAPITITMDDDLQHPAAEVPNLLAELERGFDVVYGFPRHLPHSFARNALSLVAKIVLKNGMGADNARHVSAFRALRTAVRDGFSNYHSAYVAIDVLLTWGAGRFSWIPVEHRPREIGRSNYTFRRLVTHALTVITGFSTVPLRVASLLGLLFTAVGMLLLLFVFGEYFVNGRSVPGFAFLASAISVFSGAQLFALGIVGEYLARVHMRTMGEPAYVIGATTAGV
jgi:glycosyltransferase involved in cell wall biosynthesis